MRKLVIALMVLIIVVSALLGGALYSIDSLIAAYKPSIIASVEQRIGSKVFYEEINVKLWGGVAVHVQDVSIGKDSEGRFQHLFRAKRVRLDTLVDLMGWTVTATRVVIERPVLKGVTGIHRITALFSRQLTGKYPEIFKEGTLVFEQLDAQLDTSDKAIKVKSASLKAKHYDITGKGWIGFDGVTDFDGLLTVSEGLSSDLLPDPQFSYITNKNRQLEVEFKIHGTFPEVRISPKLSIFQALLSRTLGRGLSEMIPKLEGKRGDGSIKKDRGKQSGFTVKRDPVQELIEEGLKLFGSPR